jgi:hypothetical protein
MDLHRCTAPPLERIPAVGSDMVCCDYGKEYDHLDAPSAPATNFSLPDTYPYVGRNKIGC